MTTLTSTRSTNAASKPPPATPLQAVLTHDERDHLTALADEICATTAQREGLLVWSERTRTCAHYLDGLLTGDVELDAIARGGGPKFAPAPNGKAS